MKRATLFVTTVLLGFTIAGLIALGVQYQVRLRLEIGKPLVIGFSKGAWVECVAGTDLDGKIIDVRLDGVIVADTSGVFTEANRPNSAASGNVLCPTVEIVVVDAAKKMYFVPFHYLGGLKRNEKRFWTNPFPT